MLLHTSSTNNTINASQKHILEKSPGAISCGVYFITIDQAGTHGFLRASNLNPNGLLCCAVKRKGGGEEYKDRRLNDTAVSINGGPAICHQSTLIHHLCSISCSVLSEDGVKWWKRRVRSQIRDSFPQDRITTRKLQLELREWVLLLL